MFGALAAIAALAIPATAALINARTTEMEKDVELLRGEIGSVRDEIGSLRREIDLRFQLVQQGFDTLSRDVEKAIDDGLAEQSNLVAKSLIKETVAGKVYTASVANAPWSIIDSKKWKDVYKSLQDYRLVQFNDTAILEIDFSDILGPKAMAIARIHDLALEDGVSFKIIHFVDEDKLNDIDNGTP